MYRQSSPLLKAAQTEEEFVAALQVVQLGVGEIQSIKRRDNDPLHRVTELPNGVQLVTEAFDLDGTKGRCLELVWWAMSDEEIKLAGYDCLFAPR